MDNAAIHRADGSLGEPGRSHGEVFTRRWVAELILDLVGYKNDVDLGALRVVEPSCGAGAFLVPMVDRLVASAQRYDRPLESLGEAIRAGDLLVANVDLARKAVSARLQEAGPETALADEMATTWISPDDFLLRDHDRGTADVVVGNPPYVRLEDVPRDRMAAYRAVSSTMRGRADLYVGFIEIGLSLLKPDGVLGFICADRWMRNQYGARLREMISDSFAVDSVLSMHEVSTFDDEVSAYPAVTVIRRQRQREVRVVTARKGFGEKDAEAVREWAGKPAPTAPVSTKTFDAASLPGWFEGGGFWPTGTPDELALLADLEHRLPPLEDVRTGTRVGIGVATGCDDVFITTNSSLVESDRLIPLLRSSDITTGLAKWSGSYLVDPWHGNGLVDLRDFPRMARYLHRHNQRLKNRYVARKRPEAWYRTIDKVLPGLKSMPKLVIPDLKAASNPVLDRGNFYPHHNLYWITSDRWDLEVLGGLLMSDFANLFVGAYCVQMRGGYYRFQAQYLRRIRVPKMSTISHGAALELVHGFRTRDVEVINEVAAHLYGAALPPSRRSNGSRVVQFGEAV